jgi:hypothetical protein
MGVDWYDFFSFLGIEIPLEKLVALYRRFAEEPKSVFGVHIYEKLTHSKTDCEDFEETLWRCSGFLGIVRKQFSVDELIALRHELAGFLRSNRKILNEFGIEISELVVRGGIWRKVEHYLDLLPADRESEDNDAGHRDN